MKPIYVTYSRVMLDLTTCRFAVQCENKDEAQEICYDLCSKPGIKNVRISQSKPRLPEASVLFYAEYMYNE